MRHYSCDGCGKDLTDGEGRYVVRIDSFPAVPEAALTDADLDQDQIDHMAEMLEEMESHGLPQSEPQRLNHEFDLCSHCHEKFAADPLSRESAQKLFFSSN